MTGPPLLTHCLESLRARDFRLELIHGVYLTADQVGRARRRSLQILRQIYSKKSKHRFFHWKPMTLQVSAVVLVCCSRRLLRTPELQTFAASTALITCCDVPTVLYRNIGSTLFIGFRGGRGCFLRRIHYLTWDKSCIWATMGKGVTDSEPTQNLKPSLSYTRTAYTIHEFSTVAARPLFTHTTEHFS